MDQDPDLPSGVTRTDALALIAAIYDAAVTPGGWPRVLESCREFVGGTSAAIFAKSVTGDRRELYHTDSRLDANLTQIYFSRLAPIDPSNTVQVYAEIEQGVITSQKLNPEDLGRSRFFAEWAAPQGIVDVGFATIERRGDWAALFGVFRHERDGLGDEMMRQRLSLLAPHVRRAVNIAGIIGKANHEADTFRSAIDGLAAAVLFVDGDGRLVDANHAGKALLGQSDVVKRRHEGTLRLDRKSIREMLPQADELNLRSSVLETSVGERLVVHLLPLTGGARTFSGLKGGAVAALFVQPARFEPPSIPETLARAFDLTPAELRVALSTLRHDKVADVADNLGLAEATVKTHLSHIFSKTDTKRQADIVKLVAAFSSPLTSR